MLIMSRKLFVINSLSSPVVFIKKIDHGIYVLIYWYCVTEKQVDLKDESYTVFLS